MTDNGDDGGPRYRPLNDNAPPSPEELERRMNMPHKIPMKPGTPITLTWNQAITLAEALIVCNRQHDGSQAGQALNALPGGVTAWAFPDESAFPDDE